MKPVWKVLILILTALLLFSCVTKKQERSGYFVYLTDEQKFYLLEPSAFEENMDRFQSITGKFQERIHNFGAFIKSDGNQVGITFFNQMGGNVGELLFTGDSLTANTRFFPSSTKFEYMIADFELCYCKAENLRTALSDCGLKFECISDGKCELRRVLDGDSLIVEIEKEPGRTKLKNLLRGYSYDIREEK